MASVNDIIQPDDILDLEHAIRKAEAYTSAEIRVYLEYRNEHQEPTLRARSVFHELGMKATNLENAVLFYACISSKEYAIVGDDRMEEKLPLHFWSDLEKIIQKRFQADQMAVGLFDAIIEAGIKLGEFFPYDDKGDLNELSNEVIINNN